MRDYFDGYKFVSFEGYASREEVAKLAPWACKIERVCSGYLAFESLDDYRDWTGDSEDIHESTQDFVV